MPVDEALFEALRALRKRLADEQNVPAYVVFSDATLAEMAARAPGHARGAARGERRRPDQARAVRRRVPGVIAEQASGGSAPGAAHLTAARRRYAAGGVEHLRQAHGLVAARPQAAQDRRQRLRRLRREVHAHDRAGMHRARAPAT